LVVNVKCHVNMISENVLALGNIHVLQLRYVLLKLIDRLRGILFFDDTLDVLDLLTEGFLESVKVAVSHFLEYVILIG
jgi:hypothetical protein